MSVVVKVWLSPDLPLDTGIKMRYTTALNREGNPMDLITSMCFWYAMAFGLYLINLVWDRRRSQRYVSPHASVLVLKEGPTIVGVAERPDGIGFYIATDVVDGTNEAWQ